MSQPGVYGTPHIGASTDQAQEAIAAVARINLDGAPSPRALDAMQSGNADILDPQLVTLG